MKNNDYERRKMIKWTLSILKHSVHSCTPLKTEKVETEQNSLDDSGFVHQLLRSYQSCDRNTEQTARESPGV